MIDALGNPQSVLLLGGTSDIGLALVRRWSGHGRLRVTLAGRDESALESAADDLRELGCEVTVVSFSAGDRASHRTAVAAAFQSDDLDVAVVAFGILGDAEQAWQDVDSAVEMAEVNYVAPVSVGVDLADRMRRQGHGVIVALSSVAGERVRRSNFVYGSTKAGLDGFYTGLGEALRDSGARVLVVRPGFVRTSMTAGMPAAPLAVDADRVASDIAVAVARHKDLIWVPGTLRYVMSALRHVPRPLFRRLPL